MTIFGKQHRYCPNCGKHLYDERIVVAHVKSMLCSDECQSQWERKYFDMLHGHDAPEEQ